MRRNYIYAITLVILSLFLWLSYYLYMEYRPVKYQNGTLVELPKEMIFEEWELSA